MFLKGIIYTAVAKYSNVFISLIITAIMARLLTPEEFGIVALVSVFVAFFKLLGTLGIGPAIIQIKELREEDLGSIFTFSALAAIVLAISFFLSAEFISRFYGEPQLVSVVRLLSLSVLFNVLSIVPIALNRKRLRFKQMGIVDVGINFFTGIVAIILALQGFSFYALVVESILSGLLGFIIFFNLYPVKVSLAIKSSPLKKIASFSSYQFAFNFINFFSRNLDNILIGKFLGNAALGFYNKSYTLMLLPARNLTKVITPVLHPVLSKRQNDHKYIYSKYVQLIKILSLLGFPVSVFLYFAAPELILILFGSQWDRSIPVFKILAVTIGFQVCLSSGGAIFQSVNRTDLLFISGLISAIFMIAGIFYGVFIGQNLEAIGYGLVIAFILNFFQGFYLLVETALGESFIHFLKVFLPPVVISLILFVIYFFMTFLKIDNLFLSFVLKICVILFLLGIVFFFSEEKRKLIRMVLNKN